MKTIAAVTEVVFVEDYMPDLDEYMFEETKLCLVWNPNEINPQEIAAVAFDKTVDDKDEK